MVSRPKELPVQELYVPREDPNKARIAQIVQNLPKNACIYHPQQNITNFCRETKCQRPLCPTCIPQHYEMHQKANEFANVQTIESVVQD